MMITLKKISTLKPSLQLRKLAGIFHEASIASMDKAYLKRSFEYLIESDLISKEDKQRLTVFFTNGFDNDDFNSYDDIYYYILNILGESPADWDIVDTSGTIDWSKRIIKEHYLYLDGIRSPYNIGAIFRSSESFGIKEIYLSLGCASPEHPRSRRTSRDTIDGVMWCERELETIDLPVFALELGGKDIAEFDFPKKGLCIIGSEERGVSAKALKIAKSSLGIVSIKQYGAKGSINVSCATAILLSRWMESK